MILVTSPTLEKARELSKLLLEKKMVACVNMIPSVTSMYVWQVSFPKE
jgi:periplasmic divalent cation tolerance protein